MKNKILIYGDSNLNIIDGSSIWITNLANLLAQDPNNIVDILLKMPIKNDILVSSLNKFSNVNLLTPESYLKKEKEVNYTNIDKIITKIDEMRDYSSIIVRGKNVVKTMLKTDLKDKIIPYITDFCHDDEKITIEEKDELLGIYNSVKNMFVQTIEMKNYLKKVLNIDGKKFSVLNPIVFKTEKVEKEPKTIVYAGKLAKKWYIEELLEIMDKLYDIDPEIKLYFVGNKFNSDLASKKTEILSKLKTSPNIVYIEQLSKEDTANLVKKCELGYGFRSEEIDNDKSLEISIKFLEYCSFDVPSLLRSTKQYKNILGNDYPLFVKNTDDAVKKIIDFFNNDKTKIIDNLNKSFNNYSSDKIYESIKSALYSYEQKPLRLLICGHDLKFLKPLLPYFEKDYKVTIQELKEYRIFDKKQANKLLLSNDIIWCEWMLLNACYYSKHVYPHQKLYIRAHRFEIEKNYGYLLDFNNIDKIITVSYYYYEEFLNKFNIPRNKITVINNFVETNKYKTKKEQDYLYNLALIGAVPALKGLDKAIEILIKLVEKDKKFKLYVAGKKPEDWPNSWNNKVERDYYLKIYEKIKENNLDDNVIFTGWIDNKELLTKIGYVLSLSTLESFHLAPLEGMATNSIALALPWPGIEYIYPEFTRYNSIDEIVDMILKYSKDHKLYEKNSKLGHDFVLNNYDIEIIYNNIKKVMR